MEHDRCVDLREHYPAFVTGDLSPNLTLRVQQHLSEVCGSCSTEIEALHDAFQRLPLAKASCALPEGSVEALTQKIGAQSQEVREVPIVFRETNERKLAWTLVLFATLALIAVGFWARRIDRRLVGTEDARQAAEAQTRVVSNQYRDLENRALGLQADRDALTDPRVASKNLSAVEGEGSVRAFLNLSVGHVVLTMVGLPEPGADQRYEVWWGGDAAWSYLGAIDQGVLRSGGARSFTLPEGAEAGAVLRLCRGPLGATAPTAPAPAVFEAQF